MKRYAVAYRLGFTPWERYGSAAAASIKVGLDREGAHRPRPPGRALDLGCGRGHHTSELVRRGWDVVGVDYVPEAIEVAEREAPGGTFVVGDVTNLERADLGNFDLFLDIGCFQGLSAEERLAEGRGITSLANRGATMLMLAFGPSRMRSVIGGVSQTEVVRAFAGWDLLSVEPAETAGLGWPMSRTAPQWFRLRRLD